MSSHQNPIYVGPRSYGVADGTAVSALRIVTWDTVGVTVKHSTTGDDVLGQSNNTLPADKAQRPRGDTVAVTPFGGNDGGRRLIAGAAIAAGAKLGLGTDGRAITGTGLGYMASHAAAIDEIFEAVPFK